VTPNPPEVEPHDFHPQKWRRWLCRSCYAPRILHPRLEWVRSRAIGDNNYLSPNFPGFYNGEGW